MQYVPVEFLNNKEAAAFGRYGGSVPLADLERFFYLDDTDRKLVAGQREDHNRLGFSVQLVTVRSISASFWRDPLDGVPAEVIATLRAVAEGGSWVASGVDRFVDRRVRVRAEPLLRRHRCDARSARARPG